MRFNLHKMNYPDLLSFTVVPRGQGLKPAKVKYFCDYMRGLTDSLYDKFR